MKRGFVLGTLVVAGALSTALGAAQQGRGGGQPANTAAALVADKIGDNLYVVRGKDPAAFVGGNTAVFVTAKGVTLVDTKVPGWGQALIDKVRELTDRPITTIINTHTHFDHVGSNPEFPPTVEVVTHENTANLMKEMRPVTGVQVPGGNIFKESGGRGLARRTFTDRLTLGAGNERVELYYFGPAHTGGDTWVFFPAHRTLHAGDVFPNKGLPIMDANNGGSGVQYAQTIAKAVSTLKDTQTVITGHNNTTLTLADLRTYGEFVAEFVKTVQDGKKAGRSIDEIAKGWTVPARFVKDGYSTQPAQWLRAGVEVIWNETK